MSRRAAYRVERDDLEMKKPLVIRDVGPWDQHLSVTNDAEYVVEDLVKAGRLPEGRELHYYDSEGVLDRLVVKNGKFAGFAAVRHGS